MAHSEMFYILELWKKKGWKHSLDKLRSPKWKIKQKSSPGKRVETVQWKSGIYPHWLIRRMVLARSWSWLAIKLPPGTSGPKQTWGRRMTLNRQHKRANNYQFPSLQGALQQLFKRWALFGDLGSTLHWVFLPHLERLTTDGQQFPKLLVFKL